MSGGLAATLGSDLELILLESALIERAQALYSLGFTPKALSSSQMAAAGEQILGAGTFEKALAGLRGWLGAQLTKLRAEVERGGKPKSWLSTPGAGASQSTLGEELLVWIERQSYLGDSVPQPLDRLAALRRFWDRLDGLYRYESATGEAMPLHALAHSPGGTQP